MSFAAGGSLVAAESILALTPIAIKKTPLSHNAAIWSRILSSGALGYLFSKDRHIHKGEAAGSLGLGLTNLLHIASSYESFRHLPAGQAMSLLYTYPMWILVFDSLFGSKSIGARDYLYIGLAAVGSLFLNADPGTAASSPLVQKPDSRWGIAMGLLMAVTEAGMHTILRGLGWTDPAKSVWVVNGSAAGWMAVATAAQAALTGGKVDDFGLRGGTWWDALWLTAFHSLTMFSGYWLRFFAVPRLSVVTYSILSYAGLLASYLFGLFFLGERPGWKSLIGAVMILVSGILLNIKIEDDEGSDQSKDQNKGKQTE